MNHNINEEKTETPTEHKIKKFREKGQTRYSREFNSLLVLLIGFLSLWFLKDSIFFVFHEIMLRSFCFNSKNIINDNDTLLKIFVFLKSILLVFVPFLISLLVIVTVPSVLFSGIKFNFKSLKCNLKKLNVFNGIKRIFSFQILLELFKIMLKLFVVGSISFLYLYISFPVILSLIKENSILALLHGCNIIAISCILVILGIVPIVLFDILWEQFNYYKKLKMSHQEIKDEFREKEGNPSIKIRIRQEMKANVRKRMISDIPKADVIITNPIHYSIALQYDEKKMRAPKVIAKGLGEIAIKIQQLAEKNNISIISAPLLARALYRYSKIGQYVPGPLYQAVAEVLAWVWKVRKWRKEGGIFPEKPKNIIVPSEFTSTGEHKK